jgi:hypothetical protein
MISRNSAIIALIILASEMVMPSLLFSSNSPFSRMSPTMSFERAWQLKLASLAHIKEYVTAIDTELIDKMVINVTALFEKPTFSTQNTEILKKIAYLVLREPVYSDGSALSRFNTYAKQRLITTYCHYPHGYALINELAQNNPQLQAEIEAYLS